MSGNANSGREPVHYVRVLVLAETGVTARILADDASVSMNAAGVRLRYWCKRGHLAADTDKPRGQGGLKRYTLTPLGRRELAIYYGSKAAQFDAAHALGAALGYGGSRCFTPPEEPCPAP